MARAGGDGRGREVNHRKIQNTKQTKTTAGYQNLQIKSKQATKLKAGASAAATQHYRVV